MAHVSGVVYDPPAQDLPYLAVLLHEGQVVASRAFKSPMGAATFLKTIVPQLQAKIDADKYISNAKKKKTKEKKTKEKKT